jgi:hypothetical protein
VFAAPLVKMSFNEPIGKFASSAHIPYAVLKRGSSSPPIIDCADDSFNGNHPFFGDLIIGHIGIVWFSEAMPQFEV